MPGLGKVPADLFLDVVDDCCICLFVICFQRQNVVAFSIHNLLGNLLLRPHGVDRNDRLLQVDQRQKQRNCSDFVRVLIRGHLSQCESFF